MNQSSGRERRTTAVAILSAFLGAGSDALAQQPIDLNNDGVADTVRREVRLHRIDPVISRIVMVSGTDGVPILSVASKTPNDLCLGGMSHRLAILTATGSRISPSRPPRA